MDRPADRRRFARIALAARVTVTFADAGARRELLTDNLSEGGLFLRTADPKPVGTPIRFEFALRDGGPPIRGAGIVRWVETDRAKSPGMGIRFTELDAEGRRELRSILRGRKG
jgi:uncharacterized protein (TIGR02266 family)